jgi:N-methylhydantoinase B
MAIDGRNLQVLVNYCTAAADAMAYTLMRTAHSAFVKETEDFSCTILTPEGLALASPRTCGTPWYTGIDYGPVLAMISSYEEGDICITNDPYSGQVATHTPDVHIWKPVFYRGGLACFVVGHIHNTDVGGAVPASLSRSLTDIVQEGLRVPPLKIMNKGAFNEEVAAIMRLNVRAPEQNWGDLKAQIASVNVGERKMLEIIDRFGLEDFKHGVSSILDYGHAQARRVIRSIPNGEYFFADYADEDGDNGNPCRIAVTLRVFDENIEIDYTGSDPQLSSSLNMPTGGRDRHPLALVGFNYVLATLDPSVLLNAGTVRAARAILPEGSVMNCVAPAAVGMRSLTCMVSQTATFGAFALALPGRLPACPASLSVMNVKTFDRNSMPVMASIGPVGGGGGAMPMCDGPEGSGGPTAFLRNTPVEVNEVEVPIRILRYGLWPDTGGAGRFRGGLATVMEFQIAAPNTVVTARNRDRSVLAPWGLAGGSAGANGLMLKNPGTAREINLGNTDNISCDPGDVIRVVGSGAGGYGNPLTRDPALVLRDVRCGFVSTEAAERDYGVVVRDKELDLASTDRLRQSRDGAPADRPFDFGMRRDEFERKWTKERYESLTQFLGTAPVVWRQFLKTNIFSAVAADQFSEYCVADQMQLIAQDLIERFPELRVQK